MFSGLDDSEKVIVIDAMEEKTFHKHDVVIQEGDQGDCLFVISTGTLSCYKRFKPDQDETFLKKY